MTASTVPPIPTDVFRCRMMTTSSPGITTSSSAAVANGYTFSLSDLDLASAFTGLFDQYKIEAVRFIIKPYNNAVGLVTNTTTTLPPLYVVIDYDNVTPLSTAAVAREYDNCMLIGSGESACRTFKPRMALGAYNGTFSGFANVESVWIDSVNTTVEHYGIKTFVAQATVGQTQLQSWIVEREYFLAFRKVSAGN